MKMVNLAMCFGKKFYALCSCMFLMAYSTFRFMFFRGSPFWIELCYFVSVSFLGFGVLKVFKPKTYFPRNLDLFFTSVSATTVSSMSTVEMEVFSNSQLIVLTILMFIGGEVFTSMMGLHLRKFRTKTPRKNGGVVIANCQNCRVGDDQEMGMVTQPETHQHNLQIVPNVQIEVDSLDNKLLKYKSTRFLGFVVLGYLLLIHFLGILLVLLYVAFVSSARNVLDSKGLNIVTFSFFTVVSTFASCGFVPTNENMVVFSKNSGLLLMLIPQVLLGNTLFPSCLRFFVWFLGKKLKKEEYSNYLLTYSGKKIGYTHLLPSLHSSFLVVTVFGFILAQFILFCSLEWNSDALNGMNSYQKIMGVLFQVVNSRHTGETIVDLSILSPAILVLFIVMMYLPPYTSFHPVNDDPKMHENGRKRKRKLLENIIFSQLSYLVIFVILICITERKKLKEDPLNFNALNIVLEVISAYGNVGFTTGYSCKRQLNPEMNCKDKWYGFSGKWSDEGKILLIVVMFFGRLKKFNMKGGKAWILL